MRINQSTFTIIHTLACIFLYFTWLYFLDIRNHQIKVLQERAVLEGAATWKINPDTQNKKFVWITDLFE